MGATETVATLPASLVDAPSSYGLHFRIAVTGAQNTLASYLPSSVIPTIPVPSTRVGPGSTLTYKFGYVDLQAETDPGTAQVRVTYDGQTAPTTTLGFVVPGQPGLMRIPIDPSLVKLIVSAGTVYVQVYLGIVAMG